MSSSRTSRIQVVPLAVLAIAIGARAAHADEPGSPVPGPRIRLTVPSVSGKRLVGTIVGLDEATLTLQREGAKDTVLVPRRAITRVEVSEQRSRKGKGAAIGALVGLGAAVAAGLTVGDSCGPVEGDDLGARLARNLCYDKGESALIFGILTVPAGALLGLAVAPREKWEVSTVDRLHVAVAPLRHGGVRAAVSVRF